jgi:cyclic pyranopterin phosphate synthase
MPQRERAKIKSEIWMADISAKASTKREAIAQAKVSMKKAVLMRLQQNKIPKGDVLVCAKVAGIMAAKKTDELVPLCHPLNIDNINLSFRFNLRENSIVITSNVVYLGKTGVEMEALTAVAIAALTIYDMCKPLDRDIVISDIKLLKKTGGKSGIYERKD